ncbi:hypothetical protein NQZ79_g4224 [Umbelopsis isabellina]|nr:hypothetical protein NQZ79_g4224 [Umbelopsis isabellina]
MGAAEKKRPRGLKGVAAQKAAKKAKTENEEEKTQTVILDKEVEEGDELGEVEALYETAKDKLAMGEGEDTIIPLLRGTIHECDRILRNWSGEEKAPASFYLSYGSALFDLGNLSGEKEFALYRDAAKERLETGLERIQELTEKDEASNITYAKLNIGLAKIAFGQALTSSQEGKDDVLDYINSGLDKLNTALEVKNLPVGDALEAVNLVQANADNQDALESLNILNDWAKEQYSKILKDHPENARALSGMGNCHLTLANYWLGRVDALEDESTEGKTELNEEETKASEQLTQGIEFYKRVLAVSDIDLEVKGDSTINLAEALINLANVTLDEEKQQARYQEAVTLLNEFKESTGIELPDGLASFVEEWDSQ